jgi:hypothetical protein
MVRSTAGLDHQCGVTHLWFGLLAEADELAADFGVERQQVALEFRPMKFLIGALFVVEDVACTPEPIPL